MSRARKSPNRIKQFILWSLLLVVGIAASGALYGYFWLQNYLRSDAIRVMVEQRLSHLGKGEAKIATLEWSGPIAYTSTASLAPSQPAGWTKLEAEGVQTTMDWSGIRQGTWKVTSINADWLRIALPAPAQLPVSNVAPLPSPQEVKNDQGPTRAYGSDAPVWLRSWLPQKTEIDRVEIAALQVAPPKGVPGLRLDDPQVVAKPTNDLIAWDLQSQGGKLSLPGWKAPLELKQVRARIDARALTINNGQAKWLGDSEITSRGELPFEPGRPWKFSGAVSNLELRHVLAEPWPNKLRGVLEADYDVDATGVTAKVVIKNAVVENMPVLDRVADFTRTDRFRRIALEEAKGEIEHRGSVLHVRRLVVQSSGLLRIEGDLTLRGEALDGQLYVGVSTDALRWMPGAQTQVFTESRPNGPPGFVWTPVSVSGTLDAPSEDLSNRLLAAMGKELIAAPLSVAEKGIEVLGNSAGEPGKGAAEVSKEVLKTTQDAAGKAVETGVDVLKGMVPLFGK